MSGKVINIQEAKTHLSRYVEDVVGGAELIIGKAGKPLAKLIPYKVPAKPRELGKLAGKISESADAWDEQIDADLAAGFDGVDEFIEGAREPLIYGRKSSTVETPLVAEDD